MSPFMLGVFLSSLGDLCAFLPIYSSTRAAANSNVPFSLEAKNSEHYTQIIYKNHLYGKCLPSRSRNEQSTYSFSEDLYQLFRTTLGHL